MEIARSTAKNVPQGVLDRDSPEAFPSEVLVRTTAANSCKPQF